MKQIQLKGSHVRHYSLNHHHLHRALLHRQAEQARSLAIGFGSLLPLGCYLMGEPVNRQQPIDCDAGFV
jgi:hypothetical protein